MTPRAHKVARAGRWAGDATRSASHGKRVVKPPVLTWPTNGAFQLQPFALGRRFVMGPLLAPAPHTLRPSILSPAG